MGRKDVKTEVRAAIGGASTEKVVENMPESPREKARRLFSETGRGGEASCSFFSLRRALWALHQQS